MTSFEKVIARARELDKLYPQFSHMVGLRLNIIRVKRVEEEQ